MNMETLVPKAEKKHQARKSGAKADKKELNRKKKAGISTERHNPKAFSVANVVRTKRTQQRNLDRQQKKEVVPLTNRTIDIDVPPPVFIVIMGPSSVGKSTLIRSLAKIFTGQNLTDTKGPITCVTGRKRRVTVFECPLDMYSMTDLAKVADLVLLMVDASYGFEMETFEYLNMLQLHGFPKVIGILTHLDKFKMNKTLQNTKKILKHRFWTEIYKGAKMFELSGVVNGKYLKHEVKRLSLYLTRVKFRPLTWRNTHPYVVVDRVDDVTSMSKIAQDANCDRDVALYGYVRGTHLKEGMRMHLIGAGDFDMASITLLPDPCPLPGSSSSSSGGSDSSSNGMSKKVSLKAKDALLYAPMANIGRVQITDRDGVYIELKDIHYTKKEHLSVGDQQKSNNINYRRSKKNNNDDDSDIDNDDNSDNSDDDSNEEDNDSEEERENKYKNTPMGLLRDMQDVKQGVDELMAESEMTLFPHSAPVKSQTHSHAVEMEHKKYESQSQTQSKRELQQKKFAESADDDDYGEEEEENEDEDENDSNEEEEDGNDDYDYDDDNGNDKELLGDNDDYDDGSYEDEEDDDEQDNTKQSTKPTRTLLSTTSTTQLSSSLSWQQQDVKTKAVASYMQRLRESEGRDLMRRVYWDSLSNNSNSRNNNNQDDDYDSDEDNDDDDLFVIKSSSSKQDKYNLLNHRDSSSRGSGSRSGMEHVFDKWNKALSISGNGSNKSGGVDGTDDEADDDDSSGDNNQNSASAVVAYAATSSSSNTNHNKNNGTAAGTGIGTGNRSTKSNMKMSFKQLKERFVTGSWAGSNVSLRKGRSSSNGSNSTNNTDNDGEEGGDNGSDNDSGGYDYGDNNDDEGDEDVYGDFEDLQTGEKFGSNGSGGNSNKKASKSNHHKKSNDLMNESDSDNDEEDSDDNSSVDSEAQNDEIDHQLRQMNAERKSKFKASFDTAYDHKMDTGEDDDDDNHNTNSNHNLDGTDGENDEDGNNDAKKRGNGTAASTSKESLNKKLEAEELEEQRLYDLARRLQEQQRERNKQEFGEDGEMVRIRHEGYRQGMYIRIILHNTPVEFIRNFQCQLPVVLGGLLPHESTLGVLKARIKRHRWYEKILKSNDPIIFSIGWRRYQSLPVFTIEDQNQRERFLKYTPEHMHCTCTFYGPIVPPNVGILAFQKASSAVTGFRLSMTGTILEQQATPAVLKKLKLVGTPTKIFKNTAFLTGMFNSALEVAKFEGAKLKTVSGIRGQIKKALKEGQPGSFRATFEDKILMSDIVICRLWVPVEVKQFYNPVLSLLNHSRHDKPEDWQGMRPQAQIRKEEQIPISYNKDSLYKPIERIPRSFKKVSISKKLQESLPFKSKAKLDSKQNEKSYLVRRAVILEPEDRKKRGLIQMVSTIAKDKILKRKTTKRLKSAENKKVKAKEAERWEPMKKEEKKRKSRESGKEQLRQQKSAEGGGRKSKKTRNEE